MDSAIAQSASAVAPQGIAPNLFELHNRRISVSFSATSITGQPLMDYKDRNHEVHARGDEIRVEKTEIGTLVTITLEPDADAGALLFTLVIPRAVLAAPRVEQALATVGIFTRSRLPPRLNVSAQLQTYDVVQLSGNASFIVS
ncbi:MAG: hypothetical protein ACJ8AT_11855 [Hyalangium sp.]|uniref:hypothetical protein n=1 Tax=Hyalangium sp. TaxID=2028555 RepID=UPI0038998CBE